MFKLLKRVVQKTPVSIGTKLSSLPFEYRLGKDYTDYKAIIKDNRQSTIFENVKAIVIFAESHIPFYKDFYASRKFKSSQLNSFEDLQLIPIITKNDLQKYEFELRTHNIKKGIITNTGGTSGQPLKLLLDHKAYAREWAHMHTIWEKLGYKTSKIKLTIRGMNLGAEAIRYNFVHNEFQVNAYCDFSLIVKQLNNIISKHKIEYLHGYPSGIYEFLKQLKAESPDLLFRLKKDLCGVFFGSEYPAPIYRSYIENTLCVQTVSWYGHTEMAVLASEKEPFIYQPFQSYGFTESVEIDGKHHLIGTTTHNYSGPLIRYDTGDLIDPISYQDGLLESFKITEGRIGEFVIDKNNRNISLTALIFGRHHKIFEFADFVQVHQPESGKLNVIVTTNKKTVEYGTLFDSCNMNMDISFKLVSQPYKTKSGKIPLLVKEL